LTISKLHYLHGQLQAGKRHDALLKAYAQTDQSMPLLLLGQGKYKKKKLFLSNFKNSSIVN